MIAQAALARTTTSTFPAEPRRSRVVLAKVIVSGLLRGTSVRCTMTEPRCGAPGRAARSRGTAPALDRTHEVLHGLDRDRRVEAQCGPRRVGTSVFLVPRPSTNETASARRSTQAAAHPQQLACSSATAMTLSHPAPPGRGRYRRVARRDHARSWLSGLAHAATGHPLAARHHRPALGGCPCRGFYDRRDLPRRVSFCVTARPGHSPRHWGTEPAMFPGRHTGFAEDPEGFATRLRSVLRDAGRSRPKPVPVGWREHHRQLCPEVSCFIQVCLGKAAEPA